MSQNKLSSKYLFLLLLLILSNKSIGQTSSFLWRFEAVEVDKKKLKKISSGLSKGGYQIDQQALKEGRLLLKLESLKPVRPFLRSKKSLLIYQSEQGEEVVLNGKQMYHQLFTQLEAEQKLGKKGIKKVLKGKRAFRPAAEGYYLDFGEVGDSVENLSFQFNLKKRESGHLFFERLDSYPIETLPYLEYSTCSPLNRIDFYLEYFQRSFNGIQYSAYIPEEGVKRTKTFELKFDKKQSSFHGEEITSIQEFLSDTLYEVSKAEIRAWSSVEGELKLNEKLHQERANALIQVLQKNDHAIPFQVNTEENWDLFYHQIEELGIDSAHRTQEEWKEFFISHQEEPVWQKYLDEQRKAELQLYLHVKYTDEQKHIIAIKKLGKLIGEYYMSVHKGKKPLLMRSMLAIRDFLENEVALGKMSAEKMCELNIPAEVYEYHLINFFEKMKKFDQDVSLVCNFQDLSMKTFRIIKQHLIENPKDHKVYGDLVGIQSYIYKKILSGEFSCSIADELYFPPSTDYVHLHLNYLYFISMIQAKGNVSEIITNQSQDDNKESFSDKKTPLTDIKLDVTCFDESDTSSQVDIDQAYYFLLKQVVLYNYTVHGRWWPDWMQDFETYDFLWYNITNWNPATGQLFDDEVSVEEISKQTKKLIGSLNRLCPHQAYYLAISFHTKVIQATQKSQDNSKLYKEANAFIRKFYIKHVAALNHEQAEDIARFILMGNSYDYRNEKARFAMDILERVEKRYGLDSQQRYLYFEVSSKLGIVPKMAFETR